MCMICLWLNQISTYQSSFSLIPVWSFKEYLLQLLADPLIFRPIAPIREVGEVKKKTVRLFFEALLLIHPEADPTKSFPRDVCSPSCFLAMP